MNHDTVKRAPRFSRGDRVTITAKTAARFGESGSVTGIFSTYQGVHRVYVTLDSGVRVVFADTFFEAEE